MLNKEAAPVAAEVQRSKSQQGQVMPGQLTQSVVGSIDPLQQYTASQALKAGELIACFIQGEQRMATLQTCSTNP